MGTLPSDPACVALAPDSNAADACDILVLSSSGGSFSVAQLF